MVEAEKKIYPWETLGLPPLKMVLVQAQNDRQNQLARTILESAEAVERRKKRRAIAKLIEHLNQK